MSNQALLQGGMEVASAILHSKRTAVTYEVVAKPISDYYDGFWVNVFNANSDSSALEIAAGKTFVPALAQVAVSGAKQAVLAEEVRQIADGLASLITPIYNPKGNLQRPEPKYENGKDGNTSAFFTAHFTTCPVEDSDRMVKTAAALRERVFDSLFDGVLPGFKRYNQKKTN